MSYSRSFAATVDPNRDSVLGHALPQRHILIQEKLLPQPINGIYYVDNEQPNVPSEDDIFKINYPIGSIFTSNRPLSEYEGAIIVSRNQSDNIVYSFHQCLFKYISNNTFAIDSKTLISSGRTEIRDGLYYEAPEHSGVSQQSLTISGTDYVQPHVLTVSEMPVHNHQCAEAGSHNHSIKQNYMRYGTDMGTNMVFGVSPTPDYNTEANGSHSHTIYNNGGDKGHSHDFHANIAVPINPPHIGIFMYIRIQ